MDRRVEHLDLASRSGCVEAPETFNEEDFLQRSDRLARARRVAIWVATRARSVLRYTDGKWQRTDSPDVIKRPTRRLLQDRSGTVWGGSRKQLYRFDGDSWILDAEFGASACCIEESPEGDLIVAQHMGVRVRRGTTWRALRMGPEVGQTRVRAILFDARVWRGLAQRRA